MCANCPCLSNDIGSFKHEPCSEELLHQRRQEREKLREAIREESKKQEKLRFMKMLKEEKDKLERLRSVKKQTPCILFGFYAQVSVFCFGSLGQHSFCQFTGVKYQRYIDIVLVR